MSNLVRNGKNISSAVTVLPPILTQNIFLGPGRPPPGTKANKLLFLIGVLRS